MTPAQRREFIEAVRSIPPHNRAWLRGDDPALWMYYGWGIALTSAQEEAINDVLRMPEGMAHVWRWANRAGKTSALIAIHMLATWQKWRYQTEVFDEWLGYRYQTLHVAPTGLLMGKAWEMADAWISGNGDQQKNLLTNRQREGVFIRGPWFTCRQGKRSDGSEALWIECLNGSKIDFLQTHDGAGRIEGDKWWLLDWDEFVRHQPLSAVPRLMDQTFLPRSSDHMAPLIFASTQTEEADAVYGEIEDMAKDGDGGSWWNFKSFGRETNFSQTRSSMDRQRAMAFDKATVDRSVGGGAGEGGSGLLIPVSVVSNAFDAALEPERTVADLERGLPGGELPFGRSWRLIQSFDHAIAKDPSVMMTLAAPWPPFDASDPRQAEAMYDHRIEGIDLQTQRSRASLTPDQVEAFAVRHFRKYADAGTKPAAVIVDATGEAGQMYYRALRARGLPVVPMNYTERRANAKHPNKEAGRVALQRMFSHGLLTDRVDGVLATIEVTEGTRYGLYRFPMSGPWVRFRRQLGVLKADDEKLTQDESMTALQASWYLWPFYDRGPRATISSFDIRAPRRSHVAATRAY